MWKNMKYIQLGYLMIFVLIAPAILVSSSENDENMCGDITAEDCLKKLQTFLPLKSLPFTSEEKELNKLCSLTVSGYNCSAVKFNNPNCLSSSDKDLFPVFIKMAQYLMYMFCIQQNGTIGYLRGDFLKNSECILKQKEALDCCAEGSKLTNFPVMYIRQLSNKNTQDQQMTACCPIANYLKCAIPILKKKCGENAANLTTRYIRRASGEFVEAMCQQMPDYPEFNSDICEAPPATCSGSRIGILIELILVMYIISVSRILHI